MRSEIARSVCVRRTFVELSHVDRPWRSCLSAVNQCVHEVTL